MYARALLPSGNSSPDILALGYDSYRGGVPQLDSLLLQTRAKYGLQVPFLSLSGPDCREQVAAAYLEARGINISTSA